MLTQEQTTANPMSFHGLHTRASPYLSKEMLQQLEQQTQGDKAHENRIYSWDHLHTVQAHVACDSPHATFSPISSNTFRESEHNNNSNQDQDQDASPSDFMPAEHMAPQQSTLATSVEANANLTMEAFLNSYQSHANGTTTMADLLSFTETGHKPLTFHRAKYGTVIPNEILTSPPSASVDDSIAHFNMVCPETDSMPFLSQPSQDLPLNSRVWNPKTIIECPPLYNVYSGASMTQLDLQRLKDLGLTLSYDDHISLSSRDHHDNDEQSNSLVDEDDNQNGLPDCFRMLDMETLQHICDSYCRTNRMGDQLEQQDKEDTNGSLEMNHVVTSPGASPSGTRETAFPQICSLKRDREEKVVAKTGNKKRRLAQQRVRTGPPPQFKKIEISKEKMMELSKEFSQPEAAQLLGISLSTLKRRFYEMRIGRWPTTAKERCPLKVSSMHELQSS